MLPKNNRLKNKKDFERIFKIGKGFKEDFLYIKIAPNKLPYSRFGFVVSNKFSKSAVVRNKIKRRLRELIKTRLPYIKSGFDCAIFVRPGLLIGDFWELDKKVEKLLLKAKLII